MKLRSFIAMMVIASQVLTSCSHYPGPKYPGSDYTPHASYSGDDPIDLSAPERMPSAKDESWKSEDWPWSTWDKKGTLNNGLGLGMLQLSKTRKHLLKNSLHDPHPPSFTGYTKVDCSQTNMKYRSADGTCTDPRKGNEYVGAANVAFGRNVPPSFIDKNARATMMTPNPALVSQEFFTRDEFKPVPFLNMLAAVWIQFMNHDWLTHGRNKEANPMRVPAASGGKEIVEQTKDNPVAASAYKQGFGKVSRNEVTHWWDGSQIYGSDLETQKKLRTFAGGKMLTNTVNGNELLPNTNPLNVRDNKQNQGHELSGFTDNWWVGLSMLHTLFVREHNHVADMLMKEAVTKDASGSYIWKYKKSDKGEKLTEQQLDEKLFQVARLITSAIMAKIHTVEWTPAILPNNTLEYSLYTNWYGGINPQTLSQKFRDKKTLNKADWFKVIDLGTIFGGIVGGKMKDHGTPFSITEEFTSVYRLHSLLPEKLYLQRMSSKGNINAVEFADTRNEKSYGIMSDYDTKDLFYSFGTQLPGQLVLNNFPKFMQNLEIPGHPTMDLAMVDVIRDRERGVPRYNQFRRGIGLKPIKNYKDFFLESFQGKPLSAKQQAVIAKFNKVYGKDAKGNDNVEAIDLLVGTLAEDPTIRPNNFGFGETMFQIFILMASRRLFADRFFTTNYTAAYYTQAGLDYIDKEGWFGNVIVRHMPELKPQIDGLKTAFLPWKK